MYYNNIMKVNTVGKKLSEVICAYLAGFLDGDGAIMACIESHQEKKFGFRVRVFVKITQRDRINLEWVFVKTGLGSLIPRNGYYEWLIRDQNQAKYFLDLIYPYLRCKKKQALIAGKILNRKILSKKDLLYTAHLADSLSLLNVRSKNRKQKFSTMIKDSFSRND